MRKIKTLLLTTTVVLLSLNVVAQNKGVHFESASESWNDILAKAKAENKYIFVDCYATWCGPCKMMDQMVYPDSTTGQFMNEKFISVKVQMDKTANDNADTKQWYETADMLAKNYTINAYPSMLLFSSDGKALDKITAAIVPAKNFVKAIQNELTPENQYYTTFDKLQQLPARELYQKQNLDFIIRHNSDPKMAEFIAGLIKNYQPADFREEAHQRLLIAMSSKVYAQEAVKNYLSSLSSEDLKKKGNLLVMGGFPGIFTIHDRYFELLYRQPSQLDIIVDDPGFSQYITDKVVYNQLIASVLKKADSIQRDPDWKSLEKSIIARTDQITAGRNVDNARVHFYSTELSKAEQQKSNKKFYYGKKTATALCKQTQDSMVNAFPDDGNFGHIAVLNNNAWFVFEYSSDKNELNRALMWADKAVKISNGAAGQIDTKANILYKLGQKEQALQLEDAAVKLAPKDTDLAASFRLMQQGKPTWPVPEGNKPN